MGQMADLISDKEEPEVCNEKEAGGEDTDVTENTAEAQATQQDVLPGELHHCAFVASTG